MVGGDYLARDVRALALDGRLVMIAFLGGATAEYPHATRGERLDLIERTAARIGDQSTYVIDAPPNDTAKAQLERTSILPSIKAFVARGIRVSDIAAMRLPDGYSAGEARDLCLRGSKELGLLT